MQEAAIVCSHVADKGYPILQAIRSPRLENVDSGWQFLCNSGQEEEDGKLWLVSEILEKDPTLAEWVNSPFNTTLLRTSINAPWRVWEV